MNADHLELWARIEAFDFDGGSAPSFPFVKRLARENSWGGSFTERAVREYRRFVFLCMTAGRPMCPSEEVDEVWHLHLTYTRSYWQRFCGEVLKSPLHHEPTRGGSDEGQKHWNMYADTLRAYREAFHEEPPGDLWPRAEVRFGGRAIDEAKRYWLIRKPKISWLAAAVLLVATVFVMGCQGKGNPLELKGAAYLPVLFLAYAVAFPIAFVIRRANRAPDRNPADPLPELDHYELAYLGGGRLRVLATAMVGLKDRGIADLTKNGTVRIEQSLPIGADIVEQTVFEGLSSQKSSPLDLKPLQKSMQEIEDTRFARLRELGLIASPAQRLFGTAVPLMLCLGVVGLIGGARLFLGLANGKPSGYLIVSMVVLALVSLFCFGRKIRRTYRGEAVVDELSQRNADLRTLSEDAPANGAIMAVALFGVAALTTTAYASLYSRMHKFDSTGAGGGCGNSGCSDSGCGGGGGGGCGGCGGGD